MRRFWKKIVSPPAAEAVAALRKAGLITAEEAALAQKITMADVTMAPCADMFEVGAKVEVIKKKTMYAQNAQKLYEYYVKYPSFDAIPAAEQLRLPLHVESLDSYGCGTREFLRRYSIM